MKSLSLILKWSWRDLRAHWVNVVSIALVIAIGTGAYAGLTSNANWRRMSYDASYASLNMYDVNVGLATGSYLPQGALTAAIEQIDHEEWVAAVSERLIIPTQVDASTTDESILVRGEITGADFAGDGPTVNGYYAFTGRLLTEADAGQPTVMLDRNFSEFYDLAETGTIVISGGQTLEFVGQATTPEYFAVAPEGEIFMSEANFAGVFTTLETAQQVAGRNGAVNDAVLTLAPGADRDVVVAELKATLSSLDVGTEVSTRDDNLAYQSLTMDVENDQQIFNMLAFLLFSGAVVAAYIMLHRLSQQQRREIGVAMALGVRPRRIADPATARERPDRTTRRGVRDRRRHGARRPHAGPDGVVRAAPHLGDTIRDSPLCRRGACGLPRAIPRDGHSRHGRGTGQASRCDPAALPQGGADRPPRAQGAYVTERRSAGCLCTICGARRGDRVSPPWPSVSS